MLKREMFNAEIWGISLYYIRAVNSLQAVIDTCSDLERRGVLMLVWFGSGSLQTS